MNPEHYEAYAIGIPTSIAELIHGTQDTQISRHVGDVRFLVHHPEITSWNPVDVKMAALSRYIAEHVQPHTKTSYIETPFDLYTRDLSPEVVLTIVGLEAARLAHGAQIPEQDLLAYVRKQYDAHSTTQSITIIPGFQLVVRKWPSDLFRGINYTIGAVSQVEQVKTNLLLATAMNNLDDAEMQLQGCPDAVLGCMPELLGYKRLVTVKRTIEKQRPSLLALPNAVGVNTGLADPSDKHSYAVLVSVSKREEGFPYPSSVAGAPVIIEEIETLAQFRAKKQQQHSPI